MADFTLDTSGAVGPMLTIIPWTRNYEAHVGNTQYVTWSDLSHFEQGYVEALFGDGPTGSCWRTELSRVAMARIRSSTPRDRIIAFSDLHPETLAAIRKDCAAFGARYKRSDTKARGAEFWRHRQRGFYGVAGNRGRPVFPPLTPFLDDEGRVRLREAS